MTSVMVPERVLAPGQLDAERHRLKVKLSAFEGPLDLLLHLVRINEVDIHEVPIMEIARQYDEHLELMRRLDLNIAGEFLVMAATLAYIKSWTLLPRPQEESLEESEDPGHELARRLIEHQRFQLVAESLRARRDLQSARFTRVEPPRPEWKGEVAIHASLFDLVKAFRTVLETVGRGPSGLALEPEGISVEDRMEQILDRLGGDALIEFEALFPMEAHKQEHIVTFLAILELLRLRMIATWQVRRFGEIRIARAARPGPDAGAPPFRPEES